MSDLGPMPQLNLLLSAAYLEKSEWLTLEVIGKSVHWLIDSGAFTNYSVLLKGGRPLVTLESYIQWCRKFEPWVWEYIALDEINDAKGSRENLEAMLDAGLCPMPVVVGGQAWEGVDELVKLHPDRRVCVAGGVKSKDKYAWHRYQKTFRMSGGEAKIHSLGFVRWPEMFQLPLSTCDSSSWLFGGRNGSVAIYDRRTGLSCASSTNLGDDSRRSTRQHLARCGMTAEFINDRENTRRVTGYPALCTTNAYLELHRHASLLNPAYFFVIPNTGWLLALVAVLVAKKGMGEYYDHAKAAAQLTDLRDRYRGGEEKKREALAYMRQLIEAHTEPTANPNSLVTRPRGAKP